MQLVTGGLRIHVQEEGKGEPVVLVHSSGMSSAQWRKLAGAVAAASYRALVLDLIGYGKSDPWPAERDFDLSRDVDAVLAAMEAAGPRVHLVGHSYGGLLALKAAAKDRSRVASLSVYEPVAFGVLHSKNDREGLADVASVEGESFFDEQVGGTEPWLRAFIDYWNGPGGWDRLPAAARDAFLAVGRKTFLEVRSLSRDRAPHTDYARIDAPTLVLSGASSTVAARHVAAILEDTLPHARLSLVEGAGHMGPLTHANDVNGKILDHLRRCSG
jgi:pimeloyl-ACP methyl ester carboxylesterase